MDDPTPSSTTRMDTPEPPPAGYGAAPPPPPSAGFGAAPPPPPPAGPGWDQSYRHRHRDGSGRWWSLFGGLVLLGLGLWFFADKTLGIDMPDLRWSQLWPLILIVVGVLVLLGALRRERH